MRNYRIRFNLPVIIGIFTLFVFLFSIGRVISQRWVCDDAFISFRYAKNFVDGFGLVFNRGEYVEGYTNFLWTILISGGMFFNIDPIHSSIGLGIISYIGILLLLLAGGKVILAEYFQRQNHQNYFPLAFAGFALHSHSQIYATGGLETIFFALLILAGSVLLITSNRGTHVLGAMSLFVLASMTRPEGLLFYFFASVYVWVFCFMDKDLKTYLINQIVIHFPFFVLFIPYSFWKVNYYGWFFPNTYYAKSGGETYLEQGLRYTFLYFSSYYVFVLLLLSIVMYLLRYTRIGSMFRLSLLNLFSGRYTRRRREIHLRNLKFWNANYKSSRKGFFRMTNKKQELYGKVFILIVIPSLLYISYLTKIGGDFMFARMFIHITPLFYFLMEIYSYNIKRTAYRFLMGLAIICGTLLYVNPYEDKELPIIDNITSENDIYKLQSVYKLKLELLPLAHYFEGREVRVAFGGSQAMLVYYLNPFYALEAETGLTDERLAHKKVKQRGKIGHEKPASLKYLRERRIHIHFHPENIHFNKEYNIFKIKRLPGEFRIITYDKDVFSHLHKSGQFEFIEFDKYLDRYIGSINTKSGDEIARDYNDYVKYYFNYNYDRARERRFYNRR